MIYYSIIGAYVILYAVMIARDLLRRQPEEKAKAEEVEVDISEEASQFKPVEVSKDLPELQVPIQRQTEEDESDYVLPPVRNTSQRPAIPAADRLGERAPSYADRIHKPEEQQSLKPEPTGTKAATSGTTENELPDPSMGKPTAEAGSVLEADTPAAQKPITNAGKPSQETGHKSNTASTTMENDDSPSLQRLKDLENVKYEGGIVLDALAHVIEKLSRENPNMDKVAWNIMRLKRDHPD